MIQFSPLLISLWALPFYLGLHLCFRLFELEDCYSRLSKESPSLVGETCSGTALACKGKKLIGQLSWGSFHQWLG